MHSNVTERQLTQVWKHMFIAFSMLIVDVLVELIQWNRRITDGTGDVIEVALMLNELLAENIIMSK